MAGGPLIERAVVAVQLDSVTLLEAIVEVLEEVVERRRGFVRQLGEDERIRLVGHYRAPAARRGAFGAGMLNTWKYSFSSSTVVSVCAALMSRSAAMPMRMR